MIRSFALAALIAAPSLAQSADPVVEAAREAGTVGEQADGYLGVVGAGAPDLKARVDAINIKRRAAYTDLASQRGVQPTDVAGTAACEQFERRVGPGQKYRDEGGSWQTRAGSAPVPKPSFCP